MPVSLDRKTLAAVILLQRTNSYLLFSLNFFPRQILILDAAKIAIATSLAELERHFRKATISLARISIEISAIAVLQVSGIVQIEPEAASNSYCLRK